MRYEKILVEDSEKYFDLFDPDLYNPREWAKMAKAAGMKLAVITTKHHEGFCLFKTDYTDYQALKPSLVPQGFDQGVGGDFPGGRTEGGVLLQSAGLAPSGL